MDGDEARAEAVDAGEILVAGRLVDGPLASELGLDRHHREAVGGGAAVAAALADQLIDEGSLGRILHQPALAPAALLRRAGLVVDDGGDARSLAHLALHMVEPVAVEDLDPGGEGAG